MDSDGRVYMAAASPWIRFISWFLLSSYSMTCSASPPQPGCTVSTGVSPPIASFFRAIGSGGSNHWVSQAVRHQPRLTMPAVSPSFMRNSFVTQLHKGHAGGRKSQGVPDHDPDFRAKRSDAVEVLTMVGQSCRSTRPGIQIVLFRLGPACPRSLPHRSASWQNRSRRRARRAPTKREANCSIVLLVV